MDVAATADRLRPDAVQAALSTQHLGRTLHLLDVTTSTNAAAADLGSQGAPHGTVVVAESQTAGRGRLGRSWFSPPGDGLYCSILLRDHDNRSPWPLLERLSWLPLISALAASAAIRLVGVETRLKWPNDLLVNRRKVGGLLCESASRPAAGPWHGPPFLVVGIGINVNTAVFPASLAGQVTSLALTAGVRIDRLQLLAKLLGEIEAEISRLPTTPLPQLVARYTSACMTIGHHVRVQLPGDESLEGLAESIGLDGALRIRTADRRGTVIDVRSGDVIHVRSTDKADD